MTTIAIKNDLACLYEKLKKSKTHVKFNSSLILLLKHWFAAPYLHFLEGHISTMLIFQC